MSVTASIVESPEALEQRGVFDHALLQAVLRFRPPPDPDFQPIPKHLFHHPRYLEHVTAAWKNIDKTNFTPPLELRFYNEVMKE
eukprot:2139611-Pyramimonas_sp.AAC.1